MDDQLNPRRDPLRDRETNERWRDMQDRDYSYTGPIIALIVALVIGVLLMSTWGSNTNQTGTQVGQNVERTTPTTPATPRTPNTPQ